MPGAEDASHDDLVGSLRALRPQGPAPRSLEKRLAIAAIVAGAGAKPVRARLGRLSVQRRLGGGGMGVVYQAHDPDLGRLVAVKLLRGTLQRRQRALIAAEARALAQVSHPNVVTVHEIVDRDDELYFVMEYVPGVTLRGWLDAHPDAGWREVVAWFVQAGRGLEAAHQRGIVHRDFKPENVLVGDDGRVRVADFGLAVFDAGEGADTPVGGTPHYMAPEVRRGGAAGPTSDQYAFCRALLDALEGREAPATVRRAAERGLADDGPRRHPSIGELTTLLEGALHAGRQRSRTLLLDRVERLWLRGVLQRSLGEGGAAEVTLTSVPELVDPPWKDWGDAEAGPPARSDTGGLVRALRDSHDSLLITGPPGAGKTLQLLRLCRELHRASSVDPEAPAPVVLSLSTYHPEHGRRRSEGPGPHLARWIVDELVGKYGLPRPGVARWLEAGEIAILLDGLDETEPGHRAEVVEALGDFRVRHPVPLAVTCRDSEYEALGVRLRFGGAVRLEPLDDAQVLALTEAHAAPHLAARLRQDAELRELLRNPLLLTLYASSEGRSPDADEGVPRAADWNRAYRRFVERAFEGVATEERRRLEAQLTYLARAMRQLSVTDLWLERLDFAWLRRPWERRVGYTLGVLAVLAVGVGVNLASATVGNPPPSALTFGIGVTVASFAYTRGRFAAIERLRWSWRRALRLLPLTMACATAVGLVEALHQNFWKNMAGAWLTGGVLAVAFALDASERATRVRPNAGIRRSLDYAFGVSLGFGLSAALAFAFVFEPLVLSPLRHVPEHHGDPQVVVPTAVGLFVFTALFLIYGGFTVLMHGVLRGWLALRSPLGWNLQAPLDRAVGLGLMRQVGGGYVFLHRTLLDYYAEAER